MTNYIFIETRDPFETRDTQFIEQTATALKQLGHEVTVFLIQNGVFASRRNARDSYLPRLTNAGVNLLADNFSLCERGIQTAELYPGVRPSSIEALVDALLQSNTKAIWH
jgi:sulfur relay (sulfurtransferase) complex TusBCD TusD component (DsrE family)